MGPPLSGKGTFIKTMMSKIKKVIELTESIGFKKQKNIINSQNDSKIIIEMTGQKKSQWTSVLKMLKECKYKVCGIYLDQKQQFCLHVSAFLKSLPESTSTGMKNTKQIKRFFDGLENPLKDEGYEELFVTKQF